MRGRFGARLVLLIFLAVMSAGLLTGSTRSLDAGFRAVVVTFWLTVSAALCRQWLRSGAPAERQRIIDTRGVYLLPEKWRRWLFP